MASDDSILPPHVTLLGEALQPLLMKVEAHLSEPACANGIAEVFEDFASRALDDLKVFVERLCSEANGVLNEVVSAEAPTEAGVYRAVGRFEMVFDEFLDSYSELRDLRPYPEEQGHGLLLAVYRHTLKEVEVWLRDVVESLADPMAALQKRGLPTSGDVELELSLTFTTPKEMGELRDWMKQQAKAAKKEGKRRKKQKRKMERLNEEARIEEEGSQIALGALVTLVAGICLGGLFFGDDG